MVRRLTGRGDPGADRSTYTVMRGLLAFGALLAVILLGLGLWTATPMGGGGLFDDGGAGQDVQTEERGTAEPGIIPDRDGAAEEEKVQGRVEIVDGRPVPSTVRVPRASVVTFINRDDVVRAIDFEDDRLRDADIRPGGAHTFTVSEAGRFPFSTAGDGEAVGELVVGG